MEGLGPCSDNIIQENLRHLFTSIKLHPTNPKYTLAIWNSLQLPKTLLPSFHVYGKVSSFTWTHCMWQYTQFYYASFDLYSRSPNKLKVHLSFGSMKQPWPVKQQSQHFRLHAKFTTLCLDLSNNNLFHPTLLSHIRLTILCQKFWIILCTFRLLLYITQQTQITLWHHKTAFNCKTSPTAFVPPWTCQVHGRV